MSLVNIAICDDEAVQVELLDKYVKTWADKNSRKINIEKFYTGDSFLFHWCERKDFHILLLDIEMPGINGVELSKKIRRVDSDLNIIFITAITDYIGEGYDVSAINYLIKPIKEEKLYECLDRSIEKISDEERSILIDIDGKIVKIDEKDILYIESFSHNIEINTTSGKYITRKNIGEIEKELDKDLFIRTHRSYLVSLLHIKKISKDEIELDNGECIPLSRRRYKDVNIRFTKYFRGD